MKVYVDDCDLMVLMRQMQRYGCSTDVLTFISDGPVDPAITGRVFVGDGDGLRYNECVNAFFVLDEAEIGTGETFVKEVDTEKLSNVERTHTSIKGGAIEFRFFQVRHSRSGKLLKEVYGGASIYGMTMEEIWRGAMLKHQS